MKRIKMMIATILVKLMFSHELKIKALFSCWKFAS